MSAVQPALQQNVVLHDVGWETYRRLNEEHGERSGTRFTYNEGTMQITVVGYEHERLNRLIASLIEAVCEEREIDIEPAGSNTFQREDLQKGFEPDSCFYLRQPEAIRGKRRISLAVDPPPDLVIEIDITSYSLNRLPIFAAVGVTEVWRYETDQLKIYQLGSNSYQTVSASVALPGLTASQLTEWIVASQQMKRTEWLRDVRTWVRSLAG